MTMSDSLPGLIVLIGALSLVHAFIIFRWPDLPYVQFLTAKLYRQPKNLADLNNRHWLRRDDFAQLEKDFPDLCSVIVVSKTVDRPTKELAHAVLDNFSEGVKYSFFVAHNENTDETLAQYRSWFRMLYDASMVANTSASPLSFDECFCIRRLPGQWEYVPYVFYTFSVKGSEKLLALKGNESGVGIAAGYARVAETEAKTIIDLLSLGSVAFGEEISGGEDGLVSSIPHGATTQLYVVQKPAEAA